MNTTRVRAVLLATPLLVGVAACAEDKTSIEDAPACTGKLPTMCVAPRPTYADVAPIFGERCVTCHSGDPEGPWPLTSYEHVADWAETIRDDLRTCTMPPSDSGVELAEIERQEILMWIRCGSPES